MPRKRTDWAGPWILPRLFRHSWPVSSQLQLLNYPPSSHSFLSEKESTLYYQLHESTDRAVTESCRMWVTLKEDSKSIPSGISLVEIHIVLDIFLEILSLWPHAITIGLLNFLIVFTMSGTVEALGRIVFFISGFSHRPDRTKLARTGVQ